MAIIGTKCSACLLMFGVWGVIMLFLLGIFARMNSVALGEDIPINSIKWAELKHSSEYMDEKYNTVSTNCFVAACIYLGVTVFAGIQYRLNVRSSYILSTASAPQQ